MTNSIERKALYPGSFDPPTNGHKYVMGIVSEKFDKGIVAIGHNPDKQGKFPLNERVQMLEEIAFEYPNLAVTTFSIYQADFAEMLGAENIRRGLRHNDYGFEHDISEINRAINPSVETSFTIPPGELQSVSSSMVMGLVGFEGWQQPVRNMVPKNVFDRIEARQEKIEREGLKKRWVNLHTRLQASGDPERVFNDLYERYNEPHRSYHKMPHIKTCLNELELVRDLLEDPDAVEFAIWFHDSVYESSKQKSTYEKKDDEGYSAGLARKRATQDMQLSTSFAESVEGHIQATKHSGVVENQDQAYMVDIDLAILGRSKRLFDIYEENIREEYEWVSEEDFKRGRAAILETFLPPQRETVYRTQFFIDRYETQAKMNLIRSIAKLRS